MANRICSIEGCGRPHHAKGLCSPHHQSNKRLGDPLAAKPRTGPTECRDPECERQARSAGYCGSHYQAHRWAKLEAACEVAGCENRQRTRGWCSSHYARWRRWGDPLGEMPDLLGRFWGKVDKSGDCWIWTASRSKGGYGQFNAGAGRPTAAHRYSYELANGPIPSGFHVDHKCHTPSCVRPDHLQAVTVRENSENRRGANTNNSTGVRNVTYNKSRQKYVVLVRGRSGGYYDSLEDAEFAAVYLRKRLMTNNRTDYSPLPESVPPRPVRRGQVSKPAWTGTCGICRGKIDRTRKFPDPLSKSVDHIVPVSLGGSDELENLQWACLRCNLSKGNRAG